MPTYLAWFALEFLFFIQFNRQTIWVTEEYKLLACIFIRANGFMHDGADRLLPDRKDVLVG